MIENSFLEYFLSNCDNELLRTSLDIIKPRKSTGSLTALDNFLSDKYQNFMRFSLVKDDSAFRTEPFPELLMELCQEATLLKNILDLLTEFYNCLYNDHFTFILSITGLNKDVVVNSKIKLFSRLRISADSVGIWTGQSGTVPDLGQEGVMFLDIWDIYIIYILIHFLIKIANCNLIII